MTNKPYLQVSDLDALVEFMRREKFDLVKRDYYDALKAVKKTADRLLMTLSLPQYDEHDFHLALEELVKALKDAS